MRKSTVTILDVADLNLLRTVADGGGSLCLVEPDRLNNMGAFSYFNDCPMGRLYEWSRDYRFGGTEVKDAEAWLQGFLPDDVEADLDNIQEQIEEWQGGVAFPIYMTDHTTLHFYTGGRTRSLIGCILVSVEGARKEYGGEGVDDAAACAKVRAYLNGVIETANMIAEGAVYGRTVISNDALREFLAAADADAREATLDNLRDAGDVEGGA